MTEAQLNLFERSNVVGTDFRPFVFIEEEDQSDADGQRTFDSFEQCFNEILSGEYEMSHLNYAKLVKDEVESISEDVQFNYGINFEAYFSERHMCSGIC